MCEHGDTVTVRVRVVARLSHTGRARLVRKPIDRCIAPIVRALQAEGLDMLGSCCGHGQADGEILLADGRTLVVKEPRLTAKETRRLRSEAGISMAECGRAWGYSRSYLCDVEKGRRRMTRRLDGLYRKLAEIAAGDRGPTR